MAKYYASCRSNYFKVRDSETFLSEIRKIPDIEAQEIDGSFVISGNSPDGAGWPSGYVDKDGEEIEIDLLEIVSKHLADDEVAIFMEVGAEKLRYLVGYAEAINNKGERQFIALGEIYDRAATLTNKPITKVEY